MLWASTAEQFGMQTGVGMCAERKCRLWGCAGGKEGVLSSRHFPSHTYHDEQWSENISHICNWWEWRQCMKSVSFSWKRIWWCGNALLGCLGRDSVTHMWRCPGLSETQHHALLERWLEHLCYRWIPTGPKMTVVILVWLKYNASFRKVALKPKKTKSEKSKKARI